MRYCLIFIFLITHAVIAQEDARMLYNLPHDGEVLGARWKLDNSQILSWDASSIYIWDVATQTLFQKIAVSSPNCIYSSYPVHIYWSQDRKRIICQNSLSYIIQIWDVQTGVEIFNFTLPESNFLAYIFNPDETQLLVCCQNVFQLWDVATRQLIDELDIQAGVAQFNQAGTQLLIPTVDNLYIWEVSAQGFAEKPLITIPTQSPPTEFIFFAQWIGDESHVLTVGKNGYTEVWSLEPLQNLYRIETLGWDAIPRWSPDGKYFSLDASYGVSVWNGETG